MEGCILRLDGRLSEEEEEGGEEEEEESVSCAFTSF